MKRPLHVGRAMGFAVLTAVSLLFWWRPLASTLGLALTNEAYTHILLILPLSAALIYLDSKDQHSKNLNSKALPIDPPPSPRIGAALLALALLMGGYARWGSGAASDDVRLSLAMFALVTWWIASVVFCSGLRAFRSFLLPLCFLFLLVPVPEAADLQAFNEQLRATCEANRRRTISGKSMTVGQASEHERATLLPLAAEGFPLHDVLYPLVVDGRGRVRVKTNWYSAPVPPGFRVTAVVGPLQVEIVHDNKRVAQHERCYGRGHEILNLEHYLDVLERKPGAMAGSTPLAQWREAGRWPDCLDRIWRRLEQRHGKGVGTREMIGLVREGFALGWPRLIAAVEEALRLDVSDGAAVLHILHMPDAEQRRRYAIALAEELREFERPMPTMAEYDLLLADSNGGVQ